MPLPSGGSIVILEPMSPDDLNDLARRVALNEVFVTNDPTIIQHSFGLVLGLAADAQIPDNLGAVWEELSKAGPRSINGYPFFTSAHFVADVDVLPLVERIEEKRRLLETL